MFILLYSDKYFVQTKYTTEKHLSRLKNNNSVETSISQQYLYPFAGHVHALSETTTLKEKQNKVGSVSSLDS